MVQYPAIDRTQVAESTAGQPPRVQTSTTRVAVAILLVMLIVRVASALLIVPPVVSDAQGYDASGYRLSRVGSFAYPLYDSGFWIRLDGELVIDDKAREQFLSAPANAYTMPGYPAVLGATWAVSPTGDSHRSIARLLQAVLSVATAGVVFLLARPLGERTALFALVIAAVYPPLTLANSYLITEVLYTFLLTAFVYTFVRWHTTRNVWLAAAAGTLLSLGMYVRPTMAFWIVGAAVAVVYFGAANRSQLVRQLVVMAIVSAAVMTPWWVRNYSVYGRFVPFTTSSTINLVEGLRRDAAEQPAFPWQSTPHAYSPADRAMAARINEFFENAPRSTAGDLVLVRYYGSASQDLLRDLTREYPGRMAVNRLRSIAVSLALPTAISPTAMGGYPFRVSWVLHLALLGLFVAGCVLAPKQPDVWIMISIVAYFVLFHAAVLPLQRYYFPALPVAIVIAALALGRLGRTRPASAV